MERTALGHPPRRRSPHGEDADRAGDASCSAEDTCSRKGLLTGAPPPMPRSPQAWGADDPQEGPGMGTGLGWASPYAPPRAEKG